MASKTRRTRQLPSVTTAINSFVAELGANYDRWCACMNPDGTYGREAPGVPDGWHEHAGWRALFRGGRLVEATRD